VIAKVIRLGELKKAEDGICPDSNIFSPSDWICPALLGGAKFCERNKLKTVPNVKVISRDFVDFRD
jgi:hypothetical protein